MRILIITGLFALAGCAASLDVTRSPGHLNVTVSADLTGHNATSTIPTSDPGSDGS